MVAVVAPAAFAGNGPKLPEYKTVIHILLREPDPRYGIGEGEFDTEITAKKEYACEFYRQITFYHDGVALETKHLKHQSGFFHFHVEPPVPPGRYVAKTPKKRLKGQHGAVMCSAAESNAVIVPQS